MFINKLDLIVKELEYVSQNIFLNTLNKDLQNRIIVFNIISF